MARNVIPIDKGWQFKLAGPKNYYRPVSQFPTNIHLDLMHHEIIPDPSIGKNELDVQWVGEKSWVYRTTFATPRLDQGAKAVLAFDGLDTFATVVLNGSTILESDNMFVPERVDVKGLLRDGSDNELEITFDSAYLRGWDLVKKYPEHKWGCWNGDNSRLAVRKAQYHWGWDWGPKLMTCGPWRPINLEIYTSRITDLWAKVELDDNLHRAIVETHAGVEGRAATVRFDIALGGEHICSQTVDVADEAVASFGLDKIKLWYPASYGKQPLYTLKATALDGMDEIDTVTKKIGLRKVELIQRPLKDQPGTSFFFRVNNIPMFCGGSNWIPTDNFIPRISHYAYREWIRLVADGNQVMLRVWGGGIYEEQALYDTCDELGILVWQDFMFACGNYPTWPEFRESVGREATANVKRLRHHPSIVLWAGNNEDYAYRESENLTYDPADKDPESWLKTDFPARYIYEKILADVCADLIPDTAYHFGSPFSGEKSSDQTVGDLHQWNVWHGTQDKYQDFDKLVGRFVTEFGMEAFPEVQTIEKFLRFGGGDANLYAQSATVEFHNKAAGGDRRLAIYLSENIRWSFDPLGPYTYYTQLIQSECLASAYSQWKRQWKGPEREYCAGALVWQMNDCYPAISWSICDYFLRPKPAYYVVKRELAPITLGIKRPQTKPSTTSGGPGEPEAPPGLELWACNTTLELVSVEYRLKSWDIRSGRPSGFGFVIMVDLPANQTTELSAAEKLINHKIRHLGIDWDSTVLAAYLSHGGKILARRVNWPEPLKHARLEAHTGVRWDIDNEGKVVRVSADKPTKGLHLSCESEDVRFEDNMIDVVPGETVPIGVEGVTRHSTISAFHLGLYDTTFMDRYYLAPY